MDKYRIQFNYGSAAGLAAFVLFLVYNYMGLNPIGNVSWLSAWIPVLFIVWGVKKYREEQLEGYATYRQALSTGTLIVFVYASLFAMLVYFFGTFISGDFLELYKNEALEGFEMLEKYFSESTMELMVKEIDSITIGKAAMSDFQSKFIGGIILALLIAGFLKRERPFFEEKLPNE